MNFGMWTLHLRTSQTSNVCVDGRTNRDVIKLLGFLDETHYGVNQTRYVSIRVVGEGVEFLWMFHSRVE